MDDFSKGNEAPDLSSQLNTTIQQAFKDRVGPSSYEVQDTIDQGEEVTPNTNPIQMSTGVKPEVIKPRPYQGTALIDIEDQSLEKSDMLANPDLMLLARQGLELRFGSRNLAQKASNFVAGGAGASYQSNMSDEEVYEMWQNWQRSFAGGQSVTTLNEVAFNTTLSESEKGLLGAQYIMFEKHKSIWGQDSWSEMFDGIGDYAKAAVWDPTTLMSLSVGKLIGNKSKTKIAANRLRSLSTKAYWDVIKTGGSEVAAKEAQNKVSGEVLRQSVKLKAKDILSYNAVDMGAAVVADVLYQNQLIDTGAQEEYKPVQTALVGFGSIALPAIVEGSKALTMLAKSDKAPKAFKNALKMSEELKGMTKEDINKALYGRIKWEKINADVGATFGSFSSKADFDRWSTAVAKGKEKHPRLSMSEEEGNFIRAFLFGSADNDKGGFVKSAAENGLVYVKRDDDDNITNFIGDVIAQMPKATVQKVIKEYTRAAGSKAPKTITDIKTPEELAAFWKIRQHEVGSRLWDSKHVQDILNKSFKKDGTVGSIIDDLMEDPKLKDEKKTGEYVLSMYKSILTAHLGTTGLNVKGWAGVQALNNLSDVIQGTLELSIGTLGKVSRLGSEEVNSRLIQEGRGSILGSLRRGWSFLQPGDTIESATQYFEYRPDILKELSRDLGGDSGVAAGEETLKRFNLDPKNRTNQNLEKFRDTIQTATGVKVQDELTKMLSYHTNMEMFIMREYGKSFRDFMEDPVLGYIEMHSKRFRMNVEANALDRTLRETGSKSWRGKSESSLYGSETLLGLARGVEWTSSNSGLGYALPFGKFFNTSLALIGDHTGFNFLRWGLSRSIHEGKKIINPNISDQFQSGLQSEKGLTLLSKGAVGVGGAFLLADSKVENLENGLPWKHIRREDGSILDITYDFPAAPLHIMATLIAYLRKDGEAPTDFLIEAAEILGTQTTKDLSGGYDVVKGILSAAFSEDLSSAGRTMLNAGFNATSRIVSGFTRPVDHLNQGIKLATGDFDEPDRSVQGDSWTDWKFTKKATMYSDELFEMMGLGAEESPRAVDPTNPYAHRTDMGKVMLGVRGSQGASSAQRMLASINKPTWKAFKFGNDKALKNYMGKLVAPILENKAEAYLMENPGFFDRSLSGREAVVNQMLRESKASVDQIIRLSGGPNDLYRQYKELPKKQLSRTLKFLGYDVTDPRDLLDEEGGEEMLRIIIHMAKNFNKIQEY